MNVVMLAAGTGSRLGNITKTIPKPMLQIKGKPIMEHNILLCKKYGVKRIFINLHYLSEVIIDYFGDGSKYGLDITYSYDESGKMHCMFTDVESGNSHEIELTPETTQALDKYKKQVEEISIE